MNEKEKITISKFLSYALRHKPDKIGITLDSNGWTDIDTLITQSSLHGCVFTKDDLLEIVETNDKKRFALNSDQTEIRASQGHSIDIDLNLKPVSPPNYLYHGTVEKSIKAIMKDGLLKMNRQHVHLSDSEFTAIKVGSRRGNPIVLVVNSGKMSANGFKFYVSDNGVWLTETVPPEYLLIRLSKLSLLS